MTEYVYRVVDENGDFAKPVGSRPGTYATRSRAHGLYTTAGRAYAAIRGGVGASVQRAPIGEWEDISNG